MLVQPWVLSHTIWGSEEVTAEMLASVMLVQLEMFRLRQKKAAKDSQILFRFHFEKMTDLESRGQLAASALTDWSVIFVQLTALKLQRTGRTSK
jgi:hypothetical protein